MKTIIDALGIGELAPEEQEELLLDLNELIYKGTMIRLIEQMDDSTKTQFEALMDSDADEEEVEKFLQDHVPGAEKAVEETVEELRSDILAATGASQD